MLSDQENNGLALIFLIDKRGRELQLGGCAIIVSVPWRSRRADQWRLGRSWRRKAQLRSTSRKRPTTNHS